MSKNAREILYIGIMAAVCLFATFNSKAEEPKVELYQVRCVVPDTHMPEVQRAICDYLRALAKAKGLKVNQEAPPFPHRPLRKGEVIL